jgi:type I restriction enzyme S subunit
MNNTHHIPPGYKPSPLGLIPDDWEMKELKSVAKKIMVGIATEVRPHIRQSGIPIIRNQNIRGNYFDDDEIIYISEEFDKSNKNKRVKKGDIIIVRTGSNIGQACVVPEQFDNAQTFTTLIVRPDGTLDSQYLSLHINSFGIQEVERLSAGGGKPNLNAGFLNRYRLILPPYPEQTAIANLLSTWDKAIQTITQLITQKEQRKKWLMHQLLTGMKRLKGFEKEVAFHKTDFGLKIPKEWNIVTVEDVFSERNERSSDQSKYPLFSLTIENGLTEKTERYERRFLLKDQENNQYKIVCLNDILFNPMNLRFGAIAKSSVMFPVLVSAYYNVITQSNESIDIMFYENLFKTELYNNFYERIAIGSLTEKKRVHLSNFFKLQIPLPSKEEQIAIATVLQSADKELQLLKTKAEQLKEQKKGLMQQLLTGKKRLKLK